MMPCSSAFADLQPTYAGERHLATVVGDPGRSPNLGEAGSCSLGVMLSHSVSIGLYASESEGIAR